MPGRMPTQELDPADLAVAATAAPADPTHSAAPPSVDALTAAGNGAMSRLMAGGSQAASVDPLQSLLDDGEAPVTATVPTTDTRVPDFPPESGTGGGGSSGGAGGPAGSGGDGSATTGPAGEQTPAGAGGAAGGAGGAAGAGRDSAGPVADGPGVQPGADGPGPEPVVAEPAIDPLLVDDELAEHERWGSAAGTVGTAGSAERAGWVAETVGGGFNSSALVALGSGAALELGTRAAARLAVRRFPVPMVGAVLGGAISLSGLISQFGSEEEREKVKATFDTYGTGSGYELAANNVDAVATGLDIAGNILDVIGMVAGAIAIWGWAAAIPTLGASVAWAGPASAIAIGVQVASGLIGAIKIGLQSLVLVFRALHAFESQADPRAVVASGADLAGAAGNIGGVLGGFVGGAAAGKGADRAGLVSDPNRSNARAAADALAPGGPASRHPEGPFVEVEPRTVLKADEFALADQVAAGKAANPNGTVLGADGAVAAGGPLPGATEPLPLILPGTGAPKQLVDLQGKPLSSTPIAEGQPALDLDEASLKRLLSGEIDDPDLARRIAHTVQDDPKNASTVRPRSILDPDPTPGDLRTAIGGMAGTPTHKDLISATIEDPGVAGVGYGHASYLVDENGNPMPASEATRGLGPHRGETGQVVTDPETGEKSWDPDAVLHLPGTGDHAPTGAFAVRVGDPGRWADHVFDGSDRDEALTAAIEYARVRALAGAETIANDSALPRGWAPKQKGDQVGETQPINNMNVYEINPATPRVLSTVAPQPESLPGLEGRIYPGGGPQSEMPAGTIPWGSAPRASFPVQSGFMNRRLDGTLGTIGDANDAASLGTLGGKVADSVQGKQPVPATPDQRRMEPVNPTYEAPPGTPQQLARMRGEIGEMLVCRQQADADAAAARADQAVTASRAGQVTSVAASVDTLDRSTADQQAAVADTAAANRQQQRKQAEAGASLGTLAARTAGFATLEGLLAAWGTASRAGAEVVGVFSDDAAAKMVKMANDSQHFRDQLESLNGFLTGQNAQQAPQATRLVGDWTALGGEAVRTTATGVSVRKSSQQVDAIAAQNAADTAAAADAETRAVKDSTESAVAAAEAQARHDQLSADLMAWAARHREQRRVAVEATCEKLKADGYEVVGGSFW